MTFAPGKKASGLEGQWDRDLGADIERLRCEFGTDVLVSLVEDHELAHLGIAELVDVARGAGITVARLSIPDGGVPPDEGRFVALVDAAVAHLRSARTVVVHCRGGLGRTGLFAAACLRALGLDAVGDPRRPRCTAGGD